MYQRSARLICSLAAIVCIISAFSIINFTKNNSTDNTQNVTNQPTKPQSINIKFSYSTILNQTKKKTHQPTNVNRLKTAIIQGPAQTDQLFSTFPTWSQNFAADNSTTVNTNYWNVYQGAPQNSNNEAEYYTNNPSNIHISNGALTLEATQQAEPQNYQYASARIDTQNKKTFLYGRIDLTAELPESIGVWPAAWFLPANQTYENMSPISDPSRYLNGGEIDMVEEVGVNPNTEYGIVHSLSDLNNPGDIGDYSSIVVPNSTTSYNLYTLLWTPTSITFEVNNVPFYTYTKSQNASYTTWPFDQPVYMILNLALGGSWGGIDKSTEFPNGIDNSSLPASMNIKSIYYYSYVG